MRILGEIVFLILGVAAVMVIARGLTPVAPAAAGVLRALFHPVVMVLVVGLFVLFRVGRSRGRKSETGRPRESADTESRL